MFVSLLLLLFLSVKDDDDVDDDDVDDDDDDDVDDDDVDDDDVDDDNDENNEDDDDDIKGMNFCFIYSLKPIYFINPYTFSIRK